jgi:hypothetical protein
MFRKNTEHLQQDLFNRENRMGSIQKRQLKNHWSAIFYENIFLNIDEELFSGLYSKKKSRPNIPVNILVGLEILKELLNFTDDQLYENFLFNYTFHRALGIDDINKYEFGIRTLYNFRSSLHSYETRHNVSLLKEVFKDLRDTSIEITGTKVNIQRADSVMIAANIKQMSRFTLLHKTLSNLVKEIKSHEPGAISEELFHFVDSDEGSNYYRLSKSEISKKTEEAANYLYIHVTRWREDNRIKDTESYIVAKKVLEEQCEIKNNKVRILKPEEISPGSIQNPADPDASYRVKNQDSHRGYVAHASETCSEENTHQFLTDIRIDRNIKDDSEMLEKSIEDLKNETNVESMIVDGTYPSDAVREKCNKLDVELIATDLRGKKQEEGTLNSYDFEYDEEGLVKSCPNGERPNKQTKVGDKLIANFDHKVCMKCPLREKCIAYGKKQSRLVLDNKRKWIDDWHENKETEEHKELAKLRPAVEGLMEKLKPKLSNGRILFRGLGKVKNRMILRAIGINFRRYYNWKLIQLIKILRNFLFNWFKEISLPKFSFLMR